MLQLKELLKQFDKGCFGAKDCGGCLLNKIIIDDNDTLYDICDLLIQMNNELNK